MIAELSPGLILIAGGLVAPLMPARVRPFLLVLLPIVAFAHLLTLPHGAFGQVQAMGLSLVTLRVDKLSLLFGYVFLLAAFLGGLYALHVRDTVQHASGLIYAGSALGAVFAGDLVTFFIFWEGIAIASVFLIWASRNERAYRAGMRYIIVQLASGVLLFAGVLIHYRQTSSIAFGAIGLTSPGAPLILLAFGIKCAFPLLHNWLQDAYPEATVSGTVLLSSFTTKVAVYALARGFAGTEILVPIGAAMTAFPIFYAVIENDLRRVLAYSLNNQLGFMVVGIGIGTELAINGAVAHAFADILFKGLLFMSMGAVLFRVGTVKGSELGGLYKSMPWTDWLLPRRRGVDFRIPVVQRLRNQVDGHHRCDGGGVLLDLDGAAVCQRRRLPSRRDQDSLLCILCPQFRQTLRGGARPYADGDGYRRRVLHWYRQLTRLVLFAAAVPGRLSPLQPGPCCRTGAVAVLVGARVYAVDADRHLSAGTAIDQSGFRLVLSQTGAPARDGAGSCR